MSNRDLAELVYRSLGIALAQGYDARDWSVDEIIQDLQDCDADCEDIDRDALRPHVLQWLAANPRTNKESTRQ